MIALLRITVWVLFFSVLVANSDECLATAGIAVNSGNIVRADPITQMNVSITLSNVDLTDLVGGDPMQTIYTRLAIFLTSYRNNTAVRLKYANEPSSTTTPSTTTTTTPTAPPLTLTGFSISFTALDFSTASFCSPTPLPPRRTPPGPTHHTASLLVMLSSVCCWGVWCVALPASPRRCRRRQSW